jgi:hypothetical protein
MLLVGQADLEPPLRALAPGAAPPRYGPTTP